jgi:hypothetical protein
MDLPARLRLATAEPVGLRLGVRVATEVSIR